MIAPLNLIWPNGQRPPHGQIDAVVGRPVTLRARLVLPGQSARSLTWIQLLVMNPHARVGVPWPAGSLAHQPARSARIFGADATSGQRVTLTWTPNRPGRYRVSYVERLGHGAGWGSPATILVRPAA